MYCDRDKEISFYLASSKAKSRFGINLNFCIYEYCMRKNQKLRMYIFKVN